MNGKYITIDTGELFMDEEIKKAYRLLEGFLK